mmetsp:Transcript_11444/g.24790  ORF Transcript_11444/g.24790 Transcript_11444/m.24790 type:complete len:216 (+) Transcript_11444:4017-4664(+)
MMERLGASIAWTNSVSMSASSARSVPDESVSAPTSVGLMPDISGFLITLQISPRASSALLLTFGWVSENASVSFGTTLGRQLASCLGAQWLIEPSMRMDACLVRHSGSSNASSTAGITSFTPWPDSLPMICETALSAADLTWSLLSLNAFKRAGRRTITYGSKSSLSLSLNSSIANSDPSFDVGVPLLHDSSSRLTISYFLSVAMPLPLTTAEMP